MVATVDLIVRQNQYAFLYQNEITAIVPAVCEGMKPVKRSAILNFILLAQFCQLRKGAAFIKQLLYECRHGHQIPAVNYLGVYIHQMSAGFRDHGILWKLIRHPKCILSNKFSIPYKLHGTLQQSSAQIHFQRSAGVGVVRQRMTQHIFAAFHCFYQANDLHIGEVIVFGSNTPVIVILGSCAADDFAIQNC